MADPELNIRVRLITETEKIQELKKQLKNIKNVGYSQDAEVFKKNIAASEVKVRKLKTQLNDNAKFKSLSDTTGFDEAFIKRMDVMKKKVQVAQKPFAGYALSILFAGMALRNFSLGMAKFGVKAFDEISHSVEGTVTKNDMLQGSMKYLGYVMGQALEPLIGFLIPIIDAISDWVEENPGWVSAITTVGIVLGTLMAAGGGLKLALDGFTTLTNLGKGLGKIDWSSIGDKISKGIGIIAIGYAVKEAVDAFNDIKDGKLGKGLVEAISSGLLGVGGLRMVTGKSGGGYLIAIGLGLELVAEGQFFQTISLLWGWLVAGFKTIGQQIANNFKNDLISGVVLTINNLAKLISSVFGVDFVSKIFGGKNAKGVNSLLDDLVSQMGIKESKFDFGAEYAKNLKAFKDSQKQMDASIQETLDPIGKTGGTVTVSGLTPQGNVIYNINIQEVNNNNENMQELLTEIAKRGGYANIALP